jgi:hypothetical protein
MRLSINHFTETPPEIAEFSRSHRLMGKDAIISIEKLGEGKWIVWYWDFMPV